MDCKLLEAKYYQDLLSRGQVHFRTGQFEAAYKCLRALVNWDKRDEALYGAALASMAAHELGLKEDAQQLLVSAESGLQEILEINEGHYERDWHKQAIIELTLQEARQRLSQ